MPELIRCVSVVLVNLFPLLGAPKKHNTFSLSHAVSDTRKNLFMTALPFTEEDKLLSFVPFVHLLEEEKFGVVKPMGDRQKLTFRKRLRLF